MNQSYRCECAGCTRNSNELINRKWDGQAWGRTRRVNVIVRCIRLCETVFLLLLCYYALAADISDLNYKHVAIINNIKMERGKGKTHTHTRTDGHGEVERKKGQTH